MRQRVKEHRADQCGGDGVDVRVGAQFSVFDGLAESRRQPGELRSAQLPIEILTVARASGGRGDQSPHQSGVGCLCQELGVLA